MISATSHMITKPFASCCKPKTIFTMKQEAAARLERSQGKFERNQSFCDQTTQKGFAQWNNYQDLIKAEQARNTLIQRLGEHSTPEQVAEARRIHGANLEQVKDGLLASARQQQELAGQELRDWERGSRFVRGRGRFDQLA